MEIGLLISGTLQAHYAKSMNSTLDEPMVIETGGGEQLVATANGVEARAVPLRGRAEGAELEYSEAGDPAYSLRTGSGGSGKPMVSVEGGESIGVRRLSPLECERLMNFPDYWTEGLSDSARYRALGNAVVVSVVEWIARRLVEVDAALD